MAKQMKGKHYKKCFSCGKKRALEDGKGICKKCSKEDFNERMKKIE